MCGWMTRNREPGKATDVDWQRRSLLSCSDASDAFRSLCGPRLSETAAFARCISCATGTKIRRRLKVDSCRALLADMKPLKRKQLCVASLLGPGVILSQLWFLLAHLSPKFATTYRLHAVGTTCSGILSRIQTEQAEREDRFSCIPNQTK